MNSFRLFTLSVIAIFSFSFNTYSQVYKLELRDCPDLFTDDLPNMGMLIFIDFDNNKLYAIESVFKKKINGTDTSIYPVKRKIIISNGKRNNQGILYFVNDKYEFQFTEKYVYEYFSPNKITNRFSGRSRMCIISRREVNRSEITGSGF